MTVTVAVAGASGTVGRELLRYLAGHPEFDLGSLAAHTRAGQRVAEVHEDLAELEGRAGLADRRFDRVDPKRLASADLVFLAVPRGVSSELAERLPPGLRLVDLGPDHRLADPETWRDFYESPHGGHWPMGLPEMPGVRELIATADRVATPSCFATAVLVGLNPLVAAGLADPEDVVVTVLAGASSGGRGGRPAGTGRMGPAVLGAIHGYQLGGEHGSIPEVEQHLAAVAGAPARVALTPVLAPMTRGILATCCIPVTPGTDGAALRRAMSEAYAGEPFVRLIRGSRSPSTAAVTGTNRALVQVALDDRSQRAVVVVALDNLVKGGAGQAIQVANLMFGLPDGTGLTTREESM